MSYNILIFHIQDKKKQVSHPALNARTELCKVG